MPLNASFYTLSNCLKLMLNQMDTYNMSEVHPGAKIIIYALNENSVWKLEAIRDLDGISAFGRSISRESPA
jgi:hypothetical protein